MSFSIAGKIAIVTGAANGIGLAIARHFAEQGAKVMFADMDEASLVAEIGEEAENEDSNVRYFAGDLREKLTLANLLSATIDSFDRVDILVNASRQVLRTDPLDPEDETLEVLLQQNLLAGYRLSQTIARRMIQQAEKDEVEEGQIGSIINLSSIASCRTSTDLLALSVSSAASDQMTRSLAVALSGKNIRVNSIAFGSVMSTSLQNRLRDDTELRDEIIDHTPLGRIASPTEVAQAAHYLASEASAFMTGQILTVDGGRTLLDPVNHSPH